MDYMLVGLGGFLGANARYVLGAWIADRVGSGFPLHTLFINVSGSMVIGIIMAALAQRAIDDPTWRLLAVVGFLGGYTTFSTYSLELLSLLENGSWQAAGWYALGSNLLSLAGVYGGSLVGRHL